MRSRHSGTIVNVSSGTTVYPVPVISVYAASKCAIEGLTEALQKEVAGFGIRVLMAHPGDMRTEFKGNAPITEIKQEYKGTAADLTLQSLMSVQGKEADDPAKAAERIVEAVDGTGPFEGKEYFRIPLGSDVVEMIKGRVKELSGAVEMFGDVAKSVDFKEWSELSLQDRIEGE